MAKGSIMLQIAVEQIFSTPVSQVPEIWTVVLASLDGERSVVREIASEKNQALMVMGAHENVVLPALAISDNVSTDVWLAFSDPRRPPTILHAPSHVPSPPTDGARLVLLRVRDFGMSVDEHGLIAMIRRVGSHLYLDETAP